MMYAAAAKKKNNTGFSSPWHLKKRKLTIEEISLYACTMVIITFSLPLFFSLLNDQSNEKGFGFKEREMVTKLDIDGFEVIL